MENEILNEAKNEIRRAVQDLERETVVSRDKILPLLRAMDLIDQFIRIDQTIRKNQG